MTCYICPRCNYKCKQRGDMRKHFKRKRICSVINRNVSIKDCFIDVLKETFIPKIKFNIEPKLNPIEPKLNPIEPKLNPIEPNLNPIEPKLNPIEPKLNLKKKYYCEYCEKCYSTNSHMRRHEKKCKKKNDTNNLLNFMSKQLEKSTKKINDMEKRHAKEINLLLNKIGSNTTNNIENQQINIHINKYGKENLDYITEEFLLKILKGPYNAVQKLIKHIHFNPKHPENCNIKITNKKQPYIKVFLGNDWKLKDKNELIKNMVDDRYNMIDSEFDKQENKLSENQKQRYINFQKKYDNGDKNLIKNLKKDIEIEILNNKK